MSARLQVILSLVRRDYAIQFAGTALGLVWVLVQYLFQILLFFLIFGFLLPVALPGRMELISGSNADYLSYLLGGMCLWLPLSEMLLRACGILTDNRVLVRRTSVGLHGFLWVPVIEGLVHYAILFVLISIPGVLRGQLGFFSPFAFLGGVLVILFFSGWSFVLARASVLLRDLSPLLRLMLQVVFWGTPIVYVAPERWLNLLSLNPVYFPIVAHRELLFVSDIHQLSLAGLGPFLVFISFSLIVYYLSAKRLSTLVVDHL